MDSGGPSGAGGAGPDGLPCLLSVNCDKGAKAKTTSTDRKRAETVRLNIDSFVKTHGFENCGFDTITFPEDLTLREAQRRFHNFARRELSDIFTAYIRVREFTKRGRPHYHLVVACKGDIATGFNWDYYHKVSAWSRGGRKGPKPQGKLNRTPLLAELHRRLNSKGPAYGIGRIELTPIEKLEGIGFYVGKYLSKSIGNRPPEAKRTRAVMYSRGVVRRVKGGFSWQNEAGWVWRKKLDAWTVKHQVQAAKVLTRCWNRQMHSCATMTNVKAFFGPKWAHTFREEILAMPLGYYPTAKHAQVDGVSAPEDSIDIIVTRGQLQTGCRTEPEWAEKEPEGPSEAPVGCSPPTAAAPSGSGFGATSAHQPCPPVRKYALQESGQWAAVQRKTIPYGERLF